MRTTATVAVHVKVEPVVAFEVFTEEIDQWWRRGPKYRHSGRHPGTLHLEPRLHGRLFETWHDGQQERSFEIGRVRVWEPPARLVFGWRNEAFAPDEDTEVEVTFAATSRGTLVTVRHSGFESLREDHPVRHGEDDRGFARQLGLWWGELMEDLRALAGLHANP